MQSEYISVLAQEHLKELYRAANSEKTVCGVKISNPLRLADIQQVGEECGLEPFWEGRLERLVKTIPVIVYHVMSLMFPRAHTS